MSYLQDLLGAAYKEGMSEDEISTALQNLKKPEPAPSNDDEITRLKNLLSKANSEAAGYKKQLSEKMTADEKKQAEEKEKLDKLIEENEDMKKRIAISENKTRLMGIGYEESLANETAEAMYKGDMDLIMKNQKIFLEAREKEIKAEAMKSTPKPPAGQGSTAVTREQFEKMSIAELSELYQNDPETYKRLKG